MVMLVEGKIVCTMVRKRKFAEVCHKGRYAQRAHFANLWPRGPAKRMVSESSHWKHKTLGLHDPEAILASKDNAI